MNGVWGAREKIVRSHGVNKPAATAEPCRLLKDYAQYVTINVG